VIDLSIIVVSWNTRALLLECLAAVEREVRGGGSASKLSVEAFVVDNASTDGSAEAVREAFPWVEVIELPENQGYARGNNVAIARAAGRTLLLLNSDTELQPGAIEGGLAAMDADPAAGAAGVQLLHPDGRLQNSIHAFPSFWLELLPRAALELAAPRRFPSKRRPPRAPIPVDAVLGAALFVRREVVERVGPLPEDYFFFLEETRWCWEMARAGYRVLHVPGARALHHSGASSKKKFPLATRIEYHRSLYHFLRTSRGPVSEALVRALRVFKGLVSLPILMLLAPFSGRQRERLRIVWGVLVWHVQGRPRASGLASDPPLVL
jgi:GT2 family glycosyltransferase